MKATLTAVERMQEASFFCFCLRGARSRFAVGPGLSRRMDLPIHWDAPANWQAPSMEKRLTRNSYTRHFFVLPSASRPAALAKIAKQDSPQVQAEGPDAKLKKFKVQTNSRSWQKRARRTLCCIGFCAALTSDCCNRATRAFLARRALVCLTLGLVPSAPGPVFASVARCCFAWLFSLSGRLP